MSDRAKSSVCWDPTGAGKTTTFYMVVGLIRPDEGEVFLNDENITRLPCTKGPKWVSATCPGASVFRKLSVEDNIMAVLEMTSLSKRGTAGKLESLIAEFRLQHVRKSNGDVLGGRAPPYRDRQGPGRKP